MKKNKTPKVIFNQISGMIRWFDGKLLALKVFRIAVPIKELIVGLNTFSIENDGLKYI